MSEPEEPETDDAFQTWQRNHPAGYIINAPKTGSGDMMWRQSQCPHLYGDYADAGSYMRKTKACATNPALLALWAKRHSNPLTEKGFSPPQAAGFPTQAVRCRGFSQKSARLSVYLILC